MITGVGIALGVSLCIASYGVVDGLGGDIIRSVTELEVGHVQVHQHDFLRKRGLKLTVPREDAAQLAAIPGVQAVSARAYGWALASAGPRALGVVMVGIDPAEERKVTRLAEKVIEGQFLPPEPTPWAASTKLDDRQRALDAELTAKALDAALAELAALEGGDKPAEPAPGSARAADPGGENAGTDTNALREATRALVDQIAPGPQSPPPAVLGAKLASRLGVRVGDRISLSAQDLQGNPSDVEVRVVGLLRTGNDGFDRARVLVHLADLQRFLALERLVHEITAKLDRPERATEVAAAAQARLAGTGAEARAWSALRPDVVAMVQANEGLMGALVMIILAIASLGVVSTMLMAVFERRKEIGVLKALGMQPFAQVRMIVAETVLLASASAVAGVILGLLLDLFLIRYGVDLSRFGRISLAQVGVEPVLHADITARGVLVPVVTMIFLAILGALFPALIASRTEAAIAMKEG